MSLTITTARAALLAAAGTENYPIIAWDNKAASATLSTMDGTVSPTDPESNAVTGSTYDVWSANPTADTVSIRAILASQTTVNFVAIAAHNLAAIGAGAVPQEFVASRTNLHLRSQDFSTGWQASNPTDSALTDAAEYSPYGGLTAGALLCTTTTDSIKRLRASANITVSATTAYTASIFVKSEGWTWVGVALAASTAFTEVAASARVNLSTGATTLEAGSSVLAEDYGGGWWRISITGTTGASTGYRLSVILLDADETVTSSSAGIVGSGIYAWGAQIEAGSTLTSYIPTTTAAVASVWADLARPIIPSGDKPAAWYFPDVSELNIRVRVSTSGPSSAVEIGIWFVGAVMTMDRPFYQGYAPIIKPTEVDLQSNISAGGHLLGTSVVKRGSRIEMPFSNLSDTFVRGDDFAGFMDHFNEGGGSFVAWRPTKYPDDIHYFWRDGVTIRPTNSGPKAFMSAAIEGRVYEG